MRNCECVMCSGVNLVGHCTSGLIFYNLWWIMNDRHFVHSRWALGYRLLTQAVSDNSRAKMEYDCTTRFQYGHQQPRSVKILQQGPARSMGGGEAWTKARRKKSRGAGKTQGGPAPPHATGLGHRPTDLNSTEIITLIWWCLFQGAVEMFPVF